tara:strand:+ start:188 stop:766 length:579 start_codon:yes stop_codon:yes gene_type:complete
MAHNPVGSGASIALTVDTANTSALMAHKANTLRVVLIGESGVQGAHVSIGTDASASTSDYYIVKDVPASINIFRPSSQRVVGITTGTTTTIEFPEGTGSPFGAGSSVAITVTGQSYYDDIINGNGVASVDNSAFGNGKIVVNADTSGIVTAYDSSNYAELRNSFKVSALAKGGAATEKAALYYQQVQVTGEA